VSLILIAVNRHEFSTPRLLYRQGELTFTDQVKSVIMKPILTDIVKIDQASIEQGLIGGRPAGAVRR
jgi:hypothetical protein